MNLESRLAMVNKNIQKLERVALADAEKNTENSALLTQLRALREDIISKAKLDYTQTQADVLKSFKTLMEQLATLSFFASEADKDSRDIEKAIGQLNKIKTLVSENIMGLEENKEDESSEGNQTEAKKGEGEATAATASVDDDTRNFIEQCGGKYFTSYEDWYREAKKQNLELVIDGSEVEAIIKDSDDDCLGRYLTDEMYGCLFETIEDYDKAFEAIDDEDEEEIEEQDSEDTESEENEDLEDA